MENYNVKLLDNSYTVEIPFKDHVKFLDVLDHAINHYHALVSDMTGLVNQLPLYV